MQINSSNEKEVGHTWDLGGLPMPHYVVVNGVWYDTANFDWPYKQPYHVRYSAGTLRFTGEIEAHPYNPRFIGWHFKFIAANPVAHMEHGE